MKTRMLCLLALIALFAGCDKIKDEATVPISTKLKADIPVVVTSGAKSAVEINALAFTKTYDLKLADNTDIAPYLSKIKEINLNSLVVTVTGLTAGQTINSVSLEVTGVGNIFTQTNITMSNNSFTPVIASGTLTSVAAKLTSDKKITLVVTGNASGPMSFTVTLNFDTKIIAYVL
jgi:hypothetical protein